MQCGQVEERQWEQNRQELPQCPWPTIKAAKSNGWRDLRKYEYGGQQTTLKGHILVKDPRVAQSRTAWSRQGRVVKAGEVPHALRHFYPRVSVRFEVFREDQTEQLRS